MTDKMILDVTCGDRTIWFQKNEPHTIYCDVRREEWEGDFGKTLRADGKKKHRHLVIDPDIQCSFTDLPFKDNIFSLVVFDPLVRHLCQYKRNNKCNRARTVVWTSFRQEDEYTLDGIYEI